MWPAEQVTQIIGVTQVTINPALDFSYIQYNYIAIAVSTILVVYDLE